MSQKYVKSREPKNTFIKKLYLIVTVIIGFYFYYATKNYWIGIYCGFFVLCFPFITYFVKKRLQNLMYKYSSIAKIDSMSGVEFERYLKYYFQKLGYRVKLTQASNDYGADLIARKGTEKLVIQAKRYNGRVGIKAVQEVISANIYYEGTIPMVVTNSFFTAQAKELACKSGVELWDRKYLQQHVKVSAMYRRRTSARQKGTYVATNS